MLMILRFPGNLFHRFTAMYRKVFFPRILLNLGGAIEGQHMHNLMYNAQLDLRDSFLYFQPPKALKMRRVNLSSHGEIQYNPNYLVLRSLKSVFKVRNEVIVP